MPRRKLQKGGFQVKKKEERKKEKRKKRKKEKRKNTERKKTKKSAKGRLPSQLPHLPSLLLSYSRLKGEKGKVKQGSCKREASKKVRKEQSASPFFNPDYKVGQV